MAGSTGFDPAREWLGIAAVDLADPFRALGISPAAADAATVTAAAERRLHTLRAIDPGPFRLAHESLHRRIEACRAEALAAVASRPPAAYPAPFASTPGSAGVPAPPPVPPPPPVPTTADDGAETEPGFRLRRPLRRRPASSAATPAILSALVAASAVTAAYVLWPQVGNGGVKPPKTVAVVPPRPRTQSPDVRPVTSPPARPIDIAPAPTQPPAAAQPSPAVVTPGDSRPQPDRPTPPAAEPLQPTPTPTPSPPAPTPMPVPQQEPVPVPVPPQPSREEQARVAAAVDKALREAYGALRRGEFDTADRQIATADRLAGDDERLGDRVTCWKQLAIYARQFPDYRNQALLAAGGDYDVGRTRISVIESTPDVFKYKSAGTIKRIPPADVPKPIVNAIVRTWFAAKDQPGNHLFLGCDLILHDPPGVDAARGEWAVAKRGGENVAFLEPLLDDPIIRAARQ